MYGFYNINEIIPIGGVKEKLDINKKVPVRGYTVELKSFAREGGENRDEARVMAAVNEYFYTLGSALVKDEIAVMEDKYGYLKPAGKEWDGVNDWRRRFNMWRLHGVKDYSVSFTDPIVTVNEGTATADIQGFEKILRSGGDSAAGFSTVFYLEKPSGEWKITKVDDFTEAEMHGVY